MTDYFAIRVLRIFLAMLFLTVFVQDVKGRSVSIILLVSLFIAACTFGVMQRDWHSAVLNAAGNFMFIVIQFSLLSAYIMIRFQVKTASILNYIGLGDLLFWIAVCPIMGFPDFVIHFIASLLLALALHWIFCRLNFYHARTVPLAGLQGMYYCVSLLITTF